ncbi:MAG TPA: hypothetical protein DDZ51_22475 [Planctomycetaceae bacterium]|nr:hypothetical protein [Planctomycetaceae bacterium]
MKIDLRRLTLAAFMLSTSATCSVFATAQSFVGDSEADYYGAQGGIVLDAANNESPVKTVAAVDEDEAWAIVAAKDTAVRQVAASVYIGDDVAPASGVSSHSDFGYANSQYGASISAGQSLRYESSPCGGSCGGSCNSGCDAGRGRIGAAVCKDDPTVWMKAEFLLWFPQERNTPPLGVRNAQPLVPALTLSPTATPFGDSFGGDLVPGFRGDIGRYFADGDFGIGGRVWVLGDDEDDLNFGGSGLGQSLGVPFFNTNPDPLFFGENAVFIGFNDGAPQNEGNVAVRSTLSIVAAEIYGRALLSKSKNHRFEMLGGYSHFNISDDLNINIQTTNTAALQTVFNDSFSTRNEFHGGQIGSEISVSRGRWTASSLTKVHLGNMAQRINVQGNTAQGVLPAVPAVVAGQGLFARGEVLDLNGFKRDVFAFAPEMNLKVGYQFRDHVNLHVGYTFVYWNDIALAGDQMDRSVFVDTANFNASNTTRHVEARTGGYFVQGIDLGATITF